MRHHVRITRVTETVPPTMVTLRRPGATMQDGMERLLARLRLDEVDLVAGLITAARLRSGLERRCAHGTDRPGPSSRLMISRRTR